MTRFRDDALTKAFAVVLKELREVEGLSQEQLALISGVDRTSISRLEAGSRQPSLGVVFALSRAVDQKPHKVVEMVHDQWTRFMSEQYL